MIGPIVSMIRRDYCQRIYDNVLNYMNKTNQDLDVVLSEQNPFRIRNIVRAIFIPYPNGEAGYYAARAVKDMRILGVETFVLDKESVFGLYDKLDELRDAAKKQSKLNRRNK